MRLLLILVFLSIYFIGFSQTDLLSIKISPSFHKDAQFKIIENKTDFTMSIFGDQVNETVSVKKSSLSKFKRFIPEYIIGIQRLDSIDKAELLELERKNLIRISGGDGITIEGTILDQQTIHLIKFWSPREGNVNYKFMMYLFDLMHHNFDESKTKKYIDKLKFYFPNNKSLHLTPAKPRRLFGASHLNRASA